MHKPLFLLQNNIVEKLPQKDEKEESSTENSSLFLYDI